MAVHPGGAGTAKHLGLNQCILPLPLLQVLLLQSIIAGSCCHTYQQDCWPWYHGCR